jgi:hypothetical protein
MRAKTIGKHEIRKRFAIVIGVAAAGVMALGAQTALGAQPTRTVVDLEGDRFVMPAGEGCSFDVELQASERARQTFTEFSDGRLQVIGHAEPTLINLDTGDSFVQVSRYTVIDTFDPVTNEVLEEISGRIFMQFFPGDQGPFGEVEYPGLLLSVIGDQTLTFDLDANAITAYSLDGQATDICALLSG